MKDLVGRNVGIMGWMQRGDEYIGKEEFWLRGMWFIYFGE